MMNILRILAAAAALGWAGAARADLVAHVSLTHDQETVTGTPTTSTGAARPLAYGVGTLVLNSARTQIAMTVTIYDIDVTGSQTADSNDNLTNAHIHVGAPPKSNAPVRWGFFGAPDNDNNPDNLVVTPFASGVGGTFTSVWDLNEGNAGTTLTTNLPNILAGLSYINFHTVQFGGGEIRGQINFVPEPAGVIALGTGAAALGLIGLRRRRAG
jgi:hypothetical protein